MNKSKYIELPIDTVLLPDWVLHLNDKTKYSRLVKTLKQHGQFIPVHVGLISNTYKLICGRNVFEALKQLGYDTILCYNHGIVTETEAKRICVETYLHQFECDKINLALILRELSTSFSLDDLAATFPFSKHEIKTYIMSIDFNWDSLVKESKAKVEASAQKEAKKRALKEKKIKEEAAAKLYRELAFDFYEGDTI